MSADSATSKVPVFNGKEEDFGDWWQTFTGYAGIYKFSQSIRIVKDPELPAKGIEVPDKTTDVGKKQANALPAHAGRQLHLSISAEADFPVSSLHAEVCP